MYNPTDWYWKKSGADNVYSSKRMALVPLTDEAYLVHYDAEDGVSAWPRDAAGNQTDAALQEILDPYNIDVTLISYAGRKRWMKEVAGISAGGFQVATDDRSKQMILGARVAAVADEDFTTPWVTEDGTIVELNSTQIITLSNAVLAHVQECFTTFAEVKAGIDGHTITTHDQVDEAFE